jgi:hypothetical protein
VSQNFRSRRQPVAGGIASWPSRRSRQIGARLANSTSCRAVSLRRILGIDYFDKLHPEAPPSACCNGSSDWAYWTKTRFDRRELESAL